MIINMNGAKAPETPSPTLQEKTVTPETLPTVIGADEGYDGLSQVTVNPDSQLKAENIRSGKTIFGVEGAFTGEPIYTDAIDMNEFVPFTSYIAYSYAVFFHALEGLTSVKFPVTITEYSRPEGGVCIEYNMNAVFAKYKNATYFMVSKTEYNTSSYIPPASYQWFKCSFSVPKGTYHFSAYANEGKTHVSGDFLIFTYLESNISVDQQIYTTDASLYTPIVVHVDTDIYKNAGNNAVFDVEIPEFNREYWNYSYSDKEITRIDVTLCIMPLKVRYS